MEVILSLLVGGAIGAAILAAWALWLGREARERSAAIQRHRDEAESVERRLAEYSHTPPKNPST
jgi:uncharacterized iron-regulated membrane protein